MIKWITNAIFWACCVIFCYSILLQPEEFGVLLRTWGVPGTIVDIFLADRSVQFVLALSLVLAVGYALPMIVTQLFKHYELRALADDVATARHERRSFALLELLVQDQPILQPFLHPVSSWAAEQISVEGDPVAVARRMPSELVPPAKLVNARSWHGLLKYLPILLLMVASIVALLIMVKSSDRAFAEVLSVSNTDYGTMILGVRSASAALALALGAATFTWLSQKVMNFLLLRQAERAITGLDRLVTQDDSDTVNLAAPLAFSGDSHAPGSELLLHKLHQKLSDMEMALRSLGSSGSADTNLAALHQTVTSTEERQVSLMAAVQQSMNELQSLRQDVDDIRGKPVPMLPAASNDVAVDRLTTAIRALKDTASNELPQL